MSAAGAAEKGTERAWAEALKDHRRVLDEVVATGAALDEGAWGARRHEGSWSPAEILEHLALVYEASLRDIRGQGTVGLRARGWRQRLYRWFFLPHILFHRSIPVRVRAPREARPGEGPFVQGSTLERLETLGSSFMEELTATMRRGGGGLTHPYFGRIPPLRALRFATVHLEHHHRQILEIRAAE